MKQSLYIGLITGLVAVIACSFVQRSRQRGVPALPLDNPRRLAHEVQLPLTEMWSSEARRVVFAATRPAIPSLKLQQIIPKVHFKETRLDDAIEFLQQHTEANLRVRWRTLEASGIEKSARVSFELLNVTVEQALRELLKEVTNDPRLAYQGEGNIIAITTAEELSSGTTVGRIYDVRDLMMVGMQFAARFPQDESVRGLNSNPFSPPGLARVSAESELDDALNLLIIETIDPDSWVQNGGRHGHIRYFAGHYMIIQSDPNHARIDQLLNALRRSLLSPPTTQPHAPRGQ